MGMRDQLKKAKSANKKGGGEFTGQGWLRLEVTPKGKPYILRLVSGSEALLAEKLVGLQQTMDEKSGEYDPKSGRYEPTEGCDTLLVRLQRHEYYNEETKNKRSVPCAKSAFLAGHNASASVCTCCAKKKAMYEADPENAKDLVKFQNLQTGQHIFGFVKVIQDPNDTKNNGKYLKVRVGRDVYEGDEDIDSAGLRNCIYNGYEDAKGKPVEPLFDLACNNGDDGKGAENLEIIVTKKKGTSIKKFRPSFSGELTVVDLEGAEEAHTTSGLFDFIKAPNETALENFAEIHGEEAGINKRD